MQFTHRKRDQYAFHHIFDRVCQEYGIEHRLTKTNQPWTNGQVERMNRMRKDATVKKYPDQTHQPLKAHLQVFLMSYNVAKRLKALTGLTPYEYICQGWHKEPERFTMNPYHHTLGLNMLLATVITLEQVPSQALRATVEHSLPEPGQAGTAIAPKDSRQLRHVRSTRASDQP
jgi:hypothetical protein